MARLSIGIFAALGVLAASSACITSSQSAELKLGLMAPATTLDPHFTNAGQNLALSRNFFDTLVVTNPDGGFGPGLAESWRIVDDTTWEFKLRKAAFSDGTPLKPEDVVWSINRPATITNSTASLAIYTRAIVEKVIVDDRTVHLECLARDRINWCHTSLKTASP
jgi:peptide/nickel transport system substrate-binding protein